jgi:hypothetical protein
LLECQAFSVTALAQIQAAEEGTYAISSGSWRQQQTRMSARGFDIMSLSELKPGRSDSIVCKGLDSVDLPPGSQKYAAVISHSTSRECR